MASVTYEHVYKRFDEVVAVNNLNIEIQDREFLVLVGPSGCGKSTALRVLAGLEEISEGTLKIGDRVVNDVAPQRSGHRNGISELRSISPYVRL